MAAPRLRYGRAGGVGMVVGEKVGVVFWRAGNDVAVAWPIGLRGLAGVS
jgi:hypothetical protein